MIDPMVATTGEDTIHEAFREAARELATGAVEVLPAEGLARLLQRSAQREQPLRVKFGMDPTSPDVHLGHAVVLQKLRQFQDAGHLVILVIGDYTARVGDPSGRSKSRPTVDGAAIDANARTYQEQAFRILDRARTEVRWNGEWLSRLSPLDLFTLQRCATVAQVLERDDFAKRMQAHAPISILELLYPLLQAYDSVAIEADIELGGTDQLFNLLMGRHIQPQYGQLAQSVLTMPILTGTDGVEKMSKSLGNYVGLEDEPDDVFGKVMSIPDKLMAEWYRYAAGLPWHVADEYVRGIDSGSVHPNHAKRTLARHVIERFHEPEAAAAAEARFDRQFKERGIPDDVPELPIQEIERNADGRVFVPALLVQLGWAQSNGAARRLVSGGAVRLNGTALGASELELDVADLRDGILQSGKRRFVRLR